MDNKKILIVDDDPDVRQGIVRYALQTGMFNIDFQRASSLGRGSYAPTVSVATSVENS